MRGRERGGTGRPREKTTFGAHLWISSCSFVMYVRDCVVRIQTVRSVLPPDDNKQPTFVIQRYFRDGSYSYTPTWAFLSFKSKEFNRAMLL